MKVGNYLTFKGDCAQAFDFYKSVFGTEFTARMTWEDGPMKEHVSEDQRNQIMHVSLPIPGGAGKEDFQLMGSEFVESMSHKPFQQGNNVQICLCPETTEEADRLFAKLSEGGEVESAMQNEFWGSYHGSLTDAFGVRWMIDCEATKKEG